MKALLMLAKGKPNGEPSAAPKEAPAEEESDEGGSEMEFARIASESTAAGDHEAAAEALVNAIKACLASYGPGKE